MVVGIYLYIYIYIYPLKRYTPMITYNYYAISQWYFITKMLVVLVCILCLCTIILDGVLLYGP